jgi:hypothetical protein
MTDNVPASTLRVFFCLEQITHASFSLSASGFLDYAFS